MMGIKKKPGRNITYCNCSSWFVVAILLCLFGGLKSINKLKIPLTLAWMQERIIELNMRLVFICMV
jgi:hypothetical protein